jgi:DNA invertase Pin-like site-specific DNA recombinase
VARETQKEEEKAQEESFACGGAIMKVAIYSRVSTHEQTTSGQLDELRSYCQRRKWSIVTEYTDVGISGSKESRPGLNQLLIDARRRKFDVVLVYRYDRFARSLRQLVNALCEFDALGIHFVSLHEGVDTSTPNGRLVFGIFASIAEFERELIRSRVRSGIAAARARGKRIGRPTAKVSNSEITKLLASGISMQGVAERLGCSAATICRRARGVACQLTLNPEYYDQCYVVRCPTCLKQFQTGKPLGDLLQAVERVALRDECPKHDRWPVLP